MRKRERPRGPGGLSIELQDPGRSALTFMWTVYHQTAEGMPDKFKFAADETWSKARAQSQPCTRATLAPQVLEPGRKAKALNARQPAPELDEVEEEEARAIAASSFSLLASAPTETILYGPGTFRGPVRYLAPGTPMQLYAQYEATMGLRQQQPASLRTFYRIFASIFASHLKFREKREHANCTLCEGYKLAIKARLSDPDGRRLALNKYVTHLANVWLDRQASTTSIEMAMSCSTLLASGSNVFLALLAHGKRDTIAWPPDTIESCQAASWPIWPYPLQLGKLMPMGWTRQSSERPRSTPSATHSRRW